MKRLLIVFFVFACMALSATGAKAQTYQVPCPTGSNVLNGSRTVGPNGFIAYLCVNSAGAVVFVGQCANPTSSPTPANCGGGGGSVSITGTNPIVVTPSPTTGTGVISCPTCGSGSGAPNPNYFYIVPTGQCGSTPNCVALVDDDSTDNCTTTGFTAWLTAVNAATSPQVWIEDGSGKLNYQASGNAYKFVTCNLAFTGNSAGSFGNTGGGAVHLYATIDCGQSSPNCMQFGEAGQTGFTAAEINWTLEGNGGFIGGASLTHGGVEGEPFMGIAFIHGVQFLNFGAHNATTGLCTNYAIYVTTTPQITIDSTTWYDLNSTNRCVFANIDTLGGSSTAIVTNNIWSNLGCGSVGVTDSGSASTYSHNLIYGFGANIRLEDITGDDGNGTTIEGNYFDAASCTAGGVSAEIQWGDSSNHAITEIGITDNIIDSGHVTYLLAESSLAGSSTLGDVTIANNKGIPQGTTAKLVDASQCSVGNCYTPNGNLNFSPDYGVGLGNWIFPNRSVASVFQLGQTGNLSSTTLFTPPSTSASTSWLVSCSAYVTTAASVSSTLPSCVVTFNNIFGNPSSVTITATNAGNTTATATANSVVIVAEQGVAIQISTTGYASTAAGMAYTVTATIHQDAVY